MPESVWVKSPQGVWVKDAIPSVRISTGYRPATRVYQKTGASTWTQRWYRDVTPPAKPVTLYFAMSGSTMTVTSTAPADADTAAIHYAWSTTNYPSTPPLTDGVSSDIMPVGPNGTVSKSYGSQKAGTKWYWAAWARDKAGNFSVPRLWAYTVPTIVTTPTTLSKSGYFSPVDSGSWDNNNKIWRTDNSYVYQGGTNWHGFWFYGTRISGTMARAKSISKMQISITRVNSVHGIEGEAQVYLTAHPYGSQPTGDPTGGDSMGRLIGGLNRGETKVFTIPSVYYEHILSGAYVGFGITIDAATSFTDSRYLYCYGTGSAYGRVYIDWTE